MKPSNILIFEDYKIKLGDFGSSIEMKGTKSELFK